MQAVINYVARGRERMRFFANDHSQDTVVINPVPMEIEDARGAGTTLDGDGFELVRHVSAVADFTDVAGNAELHRDEIATLIAERTGADHVVVTGGGVLRFAEKSGLTGAHDNSHPARFAHIDVSDRTAADFCARSAPEGRSIARTAQYNVWRAISSPPQDVPLALCDARSFGADDLLPADAIFDHRGVAQWQFEALLVAHGPQHRWRWFSDLDRDQAVIFKTHDSDSARAHNVPHVAFDNPEAPADAPPRASIEMRAIAYWFAD